MCLSPAVRDVFQHVDKHRIALIQATTIELRDKGVNLIARSRADKRLSPGGECRMRLHRVPQDGQKPPGRP